MALATLVVSPALHACTPIDKGAVEVSWGLYDETGSPVDGGCAGANVSEIELRWEIVEADGHGTARSTRFPCDDHHGVTGFELPPGQASLSLAPVCSTGTLGTYAAPAPIVRTITEGDVVTLDAQIIQVKMHSCTTQEPCICQ